MDTDMSVRKYWGLLVALGIVLIIIGAIAIGAATTTTIISILLFGWLLIIAGVLETLYSFWRARGWGGFVMALLIGILHIVLGFVIITNPAASAQALTLIIAFFLMFGGVFRIVTAAATRLYNWGWLFLSGVIVLLLGISIWRHWPYSGLWIIGLFIGIEMLLSGWWLLTLGLHAKKLSNQS